MNMDKKTFFYFTLTYYSDYRKSRDVTHHVHCHITVTVSRISRMSHVTVTSHVCHITGSRLLQTWLDASRHRHAQTQTRLGLGPAMLKLYVFYPVEHVLLYFVLICSAYIMLTTTYKFYYSYPQSSQTSGD